MCKSMRVALIGYGVMGQLVAAEVRKAGDEVGAVFTSKDAGEMSEKLPGHDVAIDFSIADTVLKNIEACARANVALVEGTTGWKQHEPTAKRLITKHAGAMVYGANFSIGVKNHSQRFVNPPPNQRKRYAYPQPPTRT